MNEATPNTKRYANAVPMAELATKEDLLLPFAVFDRLREAAPVRYDEMRQAWDVFAFADVHRVLSDPKAFSSRRGVDVNARQSLLTTDPPKHTQLRSLVTKAFTPKAIADLAPRIAEITNEMLDAVIPNGRMDMVHDLATPLPVIVIADLLGVPAADRHLFKEWSDTLVRGAAENTDEAFAVVVKDRQQAVTELNEYFVGILEQRRQQPQDDLISALLAAKIEGEELTQQELLSFCILLLAAGNETTTNLITNAVRLLTERPELQERLRSNPEMINAFVEEVLRYYPPIIAIGRIATQDVEVGGQSIKSGDQVISWVGAANRDPAKFAEPGDFVPDRSPNPHMSFGFGIHFCLGAPLARLEAQVALRILVNNLANLQLVEGAELTPIQSPFVFGVKGYPIQFDVLN